jgi:hypothetical protein
MSTIFYEFNFCLWLPSELTHTIREIMHSPIRDLIPLIIETVEEKHAKVLQEQDF